MDDEPIHGWFGLTYANYLVMNRTLLQSMPVEWQRKLVGILKELDETFEGTETAPSFNVSPVDLHGKYIRDPVPNYNRGRAKVTPTHAAWCAENPSSF